MSIPSNFTAPTGKENVIASLNAFLVAQIGGGQVHDGISTTLGTGNDFWWFFDYPLSSLLFPSISVSEIGLFSRASLSFDKFLGYDTDGTALKGVRNQTLVEINCWAKDTATVANATQIVRRFRDRVVYVLTNAGEIDEESPGELLVPAIPLYDYNAAMTPIRGYIEIDDSDNSIDEKYLVDPVDQNIKRYRLLVRVLWYELQK